MAEVRREEILGLEAYEAVRDAYRARLMQVKTPRRVHLGGHLTFLFENADTMRYQVQEMLRAEGRDGEADIEHELRTYNEVLGGPGELGCTLLIEIEDALQRDIVLRKWLDLPRLLYLGVSGGKRVRPTFDERQIGDDRLSSVQYLKFRCGSAPPERIGVDLPGMELEVELSDRTRAALLEDLVS